MPLMAACASASLPISTKPKPFERPVSRSIMTLADVTVPNCANACCNRLVAHAVGEVADVKFVAHGEASFQYY